MGDVDNYDYRRCAEVGGEVDNDDDEVDDMYVVWGGW